MYQDVIIIRIVDRKFVVRDKTSDDRVIMSYLRILDINSIVFDVNMSQTVEFFPDDVLIVTRSNM